MTYSKNIPSQIGKHQIEIIKTLAKQPKLSISELSKRIKTDIRHISVSVKSLLKRGYVQELATRISEKNKPVSLWGLSRRGLKIALDLKMDYSMILKAYVSIYPELERVKEADQVFAGKIKDWKKDRDKVMFDTIEVVSTLNGFGEMVKFSAIAGVFIDYYKSKNLDVKTAMQIVKAIKKLNLI